MTSQTDKTKSSGDHKQGIQVIARSAAIMRALGSHPEGLSLSGIAEKTKLPRSTVQRIVNALADEYLVQHSRGGKGFKLGPAIGRLLHLTQTDIIAEVQPLLESLSARFNESTFLANQSGPMINVIARVIAERPLRIVFPIGPCAPLHGTAAGKALLAQLDVEEQIALLSTPPNLPMRQEFDLDNALAEVETIRQGAIATDFESYEAGICAFAIGLNTYLGSFSAGLVLPSSRIEQQSEMYEALYEFKATVEERIGA